MPKYVCMFWYVQGKLWIKKEPLSYYEQKLGNRFKQRSTITYSGAHLREWSNWCAEFGYNLQEESFMFFPRGRVSYFPREEKFELVIDPCIMNDASVVDKILKDCGITRKETVIVNQSGDQSLHYICKQCKPQNFDSKGRCNL